MQRQNDPLPPAQREGANSATQLRDAAQRAMSMTHSFGAAIALLDGDELVTCASCGESVPPVGARSPVSGFTGLAFRSGQTLVCEDTQSDARVDAIVCREIKVLSMAVAPIKVGTAIRGVFAIFFSLPKATTRMRVAMLRTLADVAGAILEREPDSIATLTGAPGASERPAKTEAGSANPAPAAGDVSTITTPAGDAPPTILKEITDDEIMDAIAQIRYEPAAEQKAAQARADKTTRDGAEVASQPSRGETVAVTRQTPAPAKPAVASTAKPDVTASLPGTGKPGVPMVAERPTIAEHKSEAPQLLPAAADPTSGARPHGKRALIAPVEASPVKETPLFQAVGSRAPHHRTSRRVLVPVAGLAAVVVAVAGFMLYRSPGVNAKSSGTVAAQSVPEQLKPAPPAAQPQTSALEIEVPGAPPATATEPVKRTQVQPAKKQSAEPAPLKTAMVLPPPSLNGQARSGETPVDAPPSLANASAETVSVALPAPKLGVPAGPAPRQASVFQQARVLQMTKPVYPPFATTRRLQGTVVVQVKISKEGKVMQAIAVKGDPVLGQAAASAVKNWRYAPATRDGVPVESDGEVSVNFKLPGS